VTVRVYRSTDTSAPVIDGQTGSLINLLDKILVSGYGSMTAAGWTRQTGFAGNSSTRAAFRQGGGNQFYLDVNDAGPGAGSFLEARIRGFETMTDVSTGTGLFPTAAQFANGLFLRKSAALSATTRPWVAVADNRTFYLFIQTGDTAGTYYATMFGEIYSYLTGDGYRNMLIARASENTGVAATENLDVMSMASSTQAARTGHYIARGYTGLGGAVNVGKVGDVSAVQTASTTSGTFGQYVFPDPVTNAGWLSRLHIIDPVTTPQPNRRGYLRGLYHFPHPVASVIDQDTYVGGSGEYAGKTFMFLKLTGNFGLYCVETSDWDTSS